MVRPILEPGKEVEGLAKLATVVKTPGHIRELFKAVSDVVGALFQNRVPLVLREVPPSRRFPHGYQRRTRRRRPSDAPLTSLEQRALSARHISLGAHAAPEAPITNTRLARP